MLIDERKLKFWAKQGEKRGVRTFRSPMSVSTDGNNRSPAGRKADEDDDHSTANERLEPEGA